MDLAEALGDQQRQTRQLSPVVSIVRDREIAARCKDHFEGFEKQQHETISPHLITSTQDFLLDSSVAAWQWVPTVLTYCTFKHAPHCV